MICAAEYKSTRSRDILIINNTKGGNPGPEKDARRFDATSSNCAHNCRVFLARKTREPILVLVQILAHSDVVELCIFIRFLASGSYYWNLPLSYAT